VKFYHYHNSLCIVGTEAVVYALTGIDNPHHQIVPRPAKTATCYAEIAKLSASNKNSTPKPLKSKATPEFFSSHLYVVVVLLWYAQLFDTDGVAH